MTWNFFFAEKMMLPPTIRRQCDAERMHGDGVDVRRSKPPHRKTSGGQRMPPTSSQIFVPWVSFKRMLPNTSVIPATIMG